jgi:hypothetical protein
MKKVIAINEKENRVLTTRVNAEKNDWWITHTLEVEILPKNFLTTKTSTEPIIGNIWEGTKRFYKILKSEKVLICTVCKSKANFKIDKRFFCKAHYKHLMITRPIRRGIILPTRNDLCECGSGKKFKNCCASKYEHTPRQYFNSRYMENTNAIKTQTI